ncbi:MAG: RHS repeat-associated core domain-containing protein [Anaerosomatales bacterium]|nr:RHS repeat-associated core domain-containing protein [Anaerosomatales bacterium]
MTYDGAGREASRVASTPAGVLSLSFSDFDAAGRPCAIDAGSAGSKTRVFDQAGRLSSESGYGYASDPAVPGAELSYNGNTGRLEAEAYRFAFGGRTDSVRSYAYTADGRLASASISGMPDAAYAYEPGTGNLIGIKRGSEPTTTLAYEQGSGRIAALLSQGATQTVFSFDSRGRRASQGTPASPQTVRFFYDDADRLVGYSDASRGVSASYAYDAYGQRLRSVVASGSLVTTTTYAYDGLSLLYATTVRSDGTTESVAYLYDAAGAPLAGIYEGSAAAAPVAFFIATTVRGDVAELLDSSGAPFALYSYDAYGNPGQVRTAATARISAPLAAAVARANALRYAGYAFDAHSGLYYLSKRYYDPATAQFLTKDPAKADGEESPYQYCAGDPVGKVDPSGEWEKEFHRDMSRCVAAHLGLKSRYCDEIAAGAKQVDENLALTSIPFTPGYGLHFNVWLPVTQRALIPEAAYYMPDRSDSRLYYSSMLRRLAEEAVSRGLYRDAARMLGWGLHARQDAYAHGNLIQHAGWKKCDSTSWWSPWEKRKGLPRGWRARMATYASKAYLQGFKYLGRLK